jgi:tetratricopeptide (TPR) repeat protein
MSSIVGDTNAESLARLEEFICTSRSTLDQPTLAEGDQREQTLQTFGDALMAKYQTIHDLDALEEAINVYEETLTLWEKSHPRRAILLHTISDALFNLWLAHPTDAGSLDRCIALRREALELRSRGHAERHKTLTALSDAISSRYALRGDAEVLQEAVSLLREALTLCPPGHASRYIVCNNLANALQNTFIQCGELSYLLEAATLLREALRELPPDSPSRDYCLNNLATALQMTFEIQGNPATLTESIDLHREALSLRPQGNPSRVHSLGNLSRTLLILHSQEGNSSILKESIELQREALQLRPPGHPDRPISLDILATGLQRTFDQTGNLDALLECIALNREVVSLRPPGHHHRAVCLNNLGNALQTMYEQAEDATILDEAIHIQREALRLSVSVQLYRTRMLSNLAAVLYMRHIHQGDLDALAEAVALQREALQLSPPGHPDRYGALNNLATSLETVYFQDQDSGVLSELTDLGREALRICPPGHPFHATCLYNLSGALHSVFLQTKDTSTLNEAIQLGKDSLTHSLPGYPQRLNFLNRLAISLRLEYNSSTAETSSRLDECISLHEEALALAPSGHSFRSRQLHELARSLQGRYRRLVTLETGQRILKLLREAIACCGPIHPDRLLYLRDASIHLLNPGPVFDFSEGVTLISEALSDDLLIARSRLRAAVVVLPIVDQAFVRARNEASEPTFQDEAAPRVLSLYLRAMGLLPQVANFSLSTAARLQVLAGSEELCRAGAMRAMWLRRWETAVEMLEEGRGIFWSQALRLRSGLDGVPLTDRQELERMFHLLDSSSQQVEEFSSIAHKERDMERRRHLNLQVEELINKIRTYPGRDRFLLPPTFSVLMEAIPHGFVIMIIASSVVPGYSVLVLDASSKSIHPVFVPPSPERFRIDVIKRNMPRDIGADMSLDVDDSEPSDINPDPRGIRRARKVPVTFEDGLADLWVYLVKPILDAMGWKVSVHSLPSR